MRTFILLLLTNLCLPIVQSCRDKDEPEYECTSDNTVLLPEKAVSMFFFKEGSYWIYQREDSLYTDSVWVTSATVTNFPVDHKEFPEIKKKCYEYRSTSIKSKQEYFFVNTEYAFLIQVPINDTTYSNEFFFLYERPMLSSGKSPQPRVIYKGNLLVTDNGLGDIASMLDTFTSEGVTYTSVIHLTKDSPPAFQDYFKEAYYSSGLGLVRFKDQDNTWWNLIRYKIIQ